MTHETLPIGDAIALVEAAFRAVDVPAEAAGSVARALVMAEAEGQVGHGFSRVADYAAQVQTGKIRAGAQISVSHPADTVALIDAGHGFAYPALDRATDLVADLADRHGSGTVAIHRSHHCGALSIQVEKVAKRGCLALMVANTPPAIAPWGATAPLYGTNPIAFAAPRKGADPLVIDLSLSQVARGKIMAAKKIGRDIPAGWALDADGQPTTDPDAALAGSMLPIGGAKGTALALVVEILAAVFSGANLSRDVSSFFDAEGDPPGTGQTLMAFRPPDPAAFGERLEVLLALVEAEEGARLPGARRLQARAEAQARGVRVPVVFLDQIRELAGKIG